MNKMVNNDNKKTYLGIIIVVLLFALALYVLLSGQGPVTVSTTTTTPAVTGHPLIKEEESCTYLPDEPNRCPYTPTKVSVANELEILSSYYDVGSGGYRLTLNAQPSVEGTYFALLYMRIMGPADLTLASSERDKILSFLDEEFDDKCKSRCSPDFLYSYSHSKTLLSAEPVDSKLTARLLDLKEEYVGEEITKENVCDLVKVIATLGDFGLMEWPEKAGWAKKIAEVEPTDINAAFCQNNFLWELSNQIWYRGRIDYRNTERNLKFSQNRSWKRIYLHILTPSYLPGLDGNLVNKSLCGLAIRELNDDELKSTQALLSHIRLQLLCGQRRSLRTTNATNRMITENQESVGGRVIYSSKSIDSIQDKILAWTIVELSNRVHYANSGEQADPTYVDPTWEKRAEFGYIY